PLAIVPEPIATVIAPAGRHLAAALTERADCGSLWRGRQGVDQLGQADAAGPADDAGRDILRVGQRDRQLTLAEVADPDRAVQSEVAGPTHTAHQADDLIRDEHLVHDLRAASTPVGQLLLADAPEMLVLLFSQRQSHRCALLWPNK